MKFQILCHQCKQNKVVVSLTTEQYIEYQGSNKLIIRALCNDDDKRYFSRFGLYKYKKYLFSYGFIKLKLEAY